MLKLILKDKPYFVFFIYGLAAGVASLALSIFLKLFINVPFVPDVASQGLISITSGEIESQAVLTLGSLAKYSTFIGAILVNIILYSLIGIGLGTLFHQIRKNTFIIRVILSTLISYSILVAVAVIFLILSAVPGQQFTVPTMGFLYLVIPHIVYGVVISYLGNKDRNGKKTSNQDQTDDIKPFYPNTKSENIDYNKRGTIRAAIISAIAIPLMYLGINRLLSTSEQGQQLPQSLDTSIQQLLQSKTRPAVLKTLC